MGIARRLLMGGGGSFTIGGDVLGWINVKDYGAAGNGTTDDTSSINAAIVELNTLTRGVLYFPAGAYKVTAGLTTITAGCVVIGDGRGVWSWASGVLNAATRIQCTSATANLFTVSSQNVSLQDICLENTATGTASAGSAVRATGSDYHQTVDFDRVLITDFWIGIDYTVNSVQNVHNTHIYNSVKYGIKVQNTVESDAGGLTLTACFIGSVSGPGPDAGIRIETSGGNKVIGSTFGVNVNCIEVAPTAGSSILLVSACSMENYTGNAIDLDGSALTGSDVYEMVSIVGCQFGQYGNSTGHALYTNEVNDVAIADSIFRANTGTPTAISLNNGTRGYVGPMVNNGFGTLVATSSFTSLINNSAG